MKDFEENLCRFCSKGFCCVSCREKHEINKHKINLQCNICIFGKCTVDNLETSEKSLFYHVKTFHLPLFCVNCSIVFNQIEDIFEHRKCLVFLQKKNTPNTPFQQIYSKIYLTSYENSPNNFESQINKRGVISTFHVVTSTPMQKNKMSEKNKEITFNKNSKPEESLTPITTMSSSNSTTEKKRILENSQITNIKKTYIPLPEGSTPVAGSSAGLKNNPSSMKGLLDRSENNDAEQKENIVEESPKNDDDDNKAENNAVGIVASTENNDNEAEVEDWPIYSPKLSPSEVQKLLLESTCENSAAVTLWTSAMDFDQEDNQQLEENNKVLQTVKEEIVDEETENIPPDQNELILKLSPAGEDDAQQLPSVDKFLIPATSTNDNHDNNETANAKGDGKIFGYSLINNGDDNEDVGDTTLWSSASEFVELLNAGIGDELAEQLKSEFMQQNNIIEHFSEEETFHLEELSPPDDPSYYYRETPDSPDSLESVHYYKSTNTFVKLNNIIDNNTPGHCNEATLEEVEIRADCADDNIITTTRNYEDIKKEIKEEEEFTPVCNVNNPINGISLHDRDDKKNDKDIENNPEHISDAEDDDHSVETASSSTLHNDEDDDSTTKNSQVYEEEEIFLNEENIEEDVAAKTLSSADSQEEEEEVEINVELFEESLDTDEAETLEDESLSAVQKHENDDEKENSKTEKQQFLAEKLQICRSDQEEAGPSTDNNNYSAPDLLEITRSVSTSTSSSDLTPVVEEEQKKTPGSLKRRLSNPEEPSSAKEGRRYRKRFKYTDIKCRRSLRNLPRVRNTSSSVESNSSSAISEVSANVPIVVKKMDKATQTDNNDDYYYPRSSFLDRFRIFN